MTENARAFHRRLPGYSSTPLVDAPTVAERYGLDHLWFKDETNRFGLPSFKVLGASWAAFQLLADRDSVTLVAGSQGNHGCAVAWIARQLQVSARIYVPGAATDAVRKELADEGAEVVVVDGDYDDAVDAAACSVGDRELLVSDVARNEGDLGPSFVIEVYRTMFAEIDEQVADAGVRPPDVIAVPIGVGSLAAAAVVHFARRARVFGVEPVDAACVRASLDAGVPVTVPVPAVSAFPGLNCATPSITAWPALATGLDGVVTVDADATEAAVRDLRTVGIDASLTGAAALAGLASIAPLDGGSAVVLVTEGARS